MTIAGASDSVPGMKQMVLCAVLVIVGCASGDERNQAAFEKLKALDGTWSGGRAGAKATEIRFKTISRESAVVETWSAGTKSETMTVFSVDDGRLTATHYCAQGNRPRLLYVPTDDPQTLAFECVGGANLDDPGRAHEIAFTIIFEGPDTLRTFETYVKNGATPEEMRTAEADGPMIYRRAGAQP